MERERQRERYIYNYIQYIYPVADCDAHRRRKLLSQILVTTFHPELTNDHRLELRNDRFLEFHVNLPAFAFFNMF